MNEVVQLERRDVIAIVTVNSPPVWNRRSAHCPIHTKNRRLTASWTPSPAYRIPVPRFPGSGVFTAKTYPLVKYFASKFWCLRMASASAVPSVPVKSQLMTLNQLL